MRVLSIGTDATVFEPTSAAYMRQRAYAEKLGQMDVVILAKTEPLVPQIKENLSLHPAVAALPLVRLYRAYAVACMLPKPDVVMTQDPFETGFIGYLVARHFGVPLYVQVHTDFLSPEYAGHSVLNRIRVMLAGIVLRRAARIRVVSERIKDSVIKKFQLHIPISILPIFVDVERFKRAIPEEGLMRRFEKFKTKLLVVSRLEPEKNIALAVRSFAASAPKDACFIVVGAGSERAALEDTARELRIREQVFFEGEHDPAAYYKLADLVLFPSRYDGYGMVIVEALAAGKPVLSTDVGIAREAGAIVTSPEKFADALAHWFTNGPRVGELRLRTYESMDAYVEALKDDIVACKM